MMAFLAGGKLKEGLDRWQEIGISKEACDSVLAVSKAGGASAAEPLLNVVDQVYESFKRGKRAMATEGPQSSSKRARTDEGGASDDPEPAQATPPEGVVLSGVSVVSRGKVDVDVCPNDGIRFLHKGNRVEILANHITNILQLPHPHKHKKQVLVIVPYRADDTEVLNHFVVQLKETEKLSVTNHTKVASWDALVSNESPTAAWLPKFLKEALKVSTLLECNAKPLPCHKGATEGFIYLLDEGILFLTKTTFIPRSDLARIEVAGGARVTFDLEVELHTETKDKKGVARPVLMQFMIGREHEDTVMKYIATIHASLAKDVDADADADTNPEEGAAAGAAAATDHDSKESQGSEDESEGDEESAAQALIGDLSSDEDEDEFDPEAETSDSCAEEFDENHQSEDEDEK